MIAFALCLLALQEGGAEIAGRAVDADGKPVAGVTVALHWELRDGAMEANDGVRTGEDGAFGLPVRWRRPSVAALALDKDRRRGAIAIVDRGAADAVVLTLAPVVRADWGFDASKLDRPPPLFVGDFSLRRKGKRFSLVGFEKPFEKFTLALPAGDYALWYHGDIDLRMADTTITLKEGAAPDRIALEPSAIARHYGKEPPALTVSDARGAAKEVKLADYRGRWVLVEFWGYW